MRVSPVATEEGPFDGWYSDGQSGRQASRLTEWQIGRREPRKASEQKWVRGHARGLERVSERGGKRRRVFEQGRKDESTVKSGGSRDSVTPIGFNSNFVGLK